MINVFVRQLMVQSLLRQLWLLPRRAAIGAVTAYQQTLSPDHGPLRHLYDYGYCRHEPTCSAYAKIVLYERGFVHGSLLTIRRLLTCHPWRKPDDARMLRAIRRSDRA